MSNKLKGEIKLKDKVEYIRHDRVEHQLNGEYIIVLDFCTPKVNGVLKNITTINEISKEWAHN